MAALSKVFAIIALNAVVSLANPALPLLARQGPATCRDQSCAIATVAGSTGATKYEFDFIPTGDTYSGDCCIIKHFPANKEAIYSQRDGLREYCAITGGDAPVDTNPPGVDKIEITGVAKRDTTATAPCRPNILIWAKGTFEPGDVGISIGNTISNSLDDTKWQVVGVNYDNSIDGIYCLGLPGAKIARQTFQQVTTLCPNSKLFVGGYSQGAMVVRNAIARIPADQVAKISNVITFGDPFCGANIGQYSGPINVFCEPTDGVCNGRNDIGLGHLSYSAHTAAAIALLKSLQA